MIFWEYMSIFINGAYSIGWFSTLFTVYPFPLIAANSFL